MHLLQHVRSVQSPVAVEVSSVVSAMSPMKASTKAQDAKSKAQDAKSKAPDAKTKAQDAKPKGGKAMGILAIAQQLVAKAPSAQPDPPPAQTSSPKSPRRVVEVHHPSRLLRSPSPPRRRLSSRKGVCTASLPDECPTQSRPPNDCLLLLPQWLRAPCPSWRTRDPSLCIVLC